MKKRGSQLNDCTRLIMPSKSLFKLIVFLTLFAFQIQAQVRFFPENGNGLELPTYPYIQTLHSGIQNDTFYMRGKFGVDFPVMEYSFSDYRLNWGIAASAHLNMIPKNMKFAVDNFYAVLGIFLSGGESHGVSWRLYPVYHLSAHLADGFRGDILKKDVKAVSSEMIFGQLFFKASDKVQLGMGYGWYYHTCTQSSLRQRMEWQVLLTPVKNSFIRPFSHLKWEVVDQDGLQPGIDISAGSFFMHDNRGAGISLRFFNKLHSSYYWKEYEKGWGVEYLFTY